MLKSIYRHAVLTALITIPLSPAAAAETLAGFSAGADNLTAGRESWRHASAFIENGNTGGNIGGLRINHTRRFGLEDYQLEGFYSFRTSERLRLSIDANASPTHHVLARTGVGASLQFEAARGWLLHGGARVNSYDATTVNQLSTGVEHYFGDWGAALTVFNSHTYSQNSQTAVARLSRYYGERNRVNLILASGREPTNLAGDIVNSDVRSMTLTGRHWVRQQVAVDYTFGTVRQGEFYSRTGGSLGLVVAF